MNAYLWMVRHNATQEQIDRIEAALKPPTDYKHKGAPVWWKGDQDAFSGWG